MERAVIHIGGPLGSGKTMLVEAVLAASNQTLLVARCVRDDRLRQAREASPHGDPELRRYRAAGASGAARFSFPTGLESFPDFFDTNLMTDFSDAIILEGNSPLGHADVTVFVAPAPEVGEALFVRRSRDQAAAGRAGADELERMLRQPAGVAQWLERALGRPVSDYVRRNPSMAEELRKQLLLGIERFRDAPASSPVDHWAVTERFRGIENAGVVVVNVRAGGERSGAEQLAADALRLRQDKALFDDILGWRGQRTPITAVVADLADPRDPGRRKAIARIRRSLRVRPE
ncbi:MAG: hypothetical protein ACYCZN_11380 [Candidatus Dormibacteria bacterium]